MEEITTITVVLRKVVADKAAAIAAYELVKQKLASVPDVRIAGKINIQLIEPEP